MATGAQIWGLETVTPARLESYWVSSPLPLENGPEGESIFSEFHIAGLPSVGHRTGLCTLAVPAGLFVFGCDTRTSNQPVVESEAIGSFLRNAADISKESYNYSAAAAYYQSLYDRDPDDITVVLGLARNLRYTGKTDQAIKIIELIERQSG